MSVRIRWLTDEFRPRTVPIFWAAEGPKSQILARPLADAILMGCGITPDVIRNLIENYRSDGGVAINERVEELAGEHGVTMSQIALAWLLHHKTVDAPIVGSTSVEHLEEAVKATEISLSDGDVSYLEDPYEPCAVDGHE